TTLILLLVASVIAIVITPLLLLKIVLGPVIAFLWFALGNVTVHHHQTHHNATNSQFARRCLNAIHFVTLPDGGKHLKRYRRAHMHHHANPLHETDVDHRYAMEHYQSMSRNTWTKIIYYLELTFVGGHVPGQKDEDYMNRVPVADWKLKDYQQVKKREVQKAPRNAMIGWAIFLVTLLVVPGIAWGLIYPLLLLKNWSGFLSQFQHFDDKMLDSSRSRNNRTKTYWFPRLINWLAGGEISGHFVHHIYPELPYYNVEAARRRILQQPELVQLVVNY
ncbi:MAG: fatty acid desaturase, partial [Planctomycetales bacterium]